MTQTANIHSRSTPDLKLPSAWQARDSDFQIRLASCMQAISKFESDVENGLFDLSRHKMVLDEALSLFDGDEFRSVRRESTRLAALIAEDASFGRYKAAVSAVHDSYRQLSLIWFEFEGRFSLDVKKRYLKSGFGIVDDYSLLLPVASRMVGDERDELLKTIAEQLKLAEENDRILSNQDVTLSQLIERCRVQFAVSERARKDVAITIKSMSPNTQLSLQCLFECLMVLQLPVVVRFVFLNQLQEHVLPVSMPGSEVWSLSTGLFAELKEYASKEVSILSEESSWMLLIPGVEQKAQSEVSRCEMRSLYIEDSEPGDGDNVSQYDRCDASSFLTRFCLLVEEAQHQTGSGDFRENDDRLSRNLRRLKEDTEKWLAEHYQEEDARAALTAIQSGCNAENDNLLLTNEQEFALRALLLRNAEMLGLSILASRAESELFLRNGNMDAALESLLAARSSIRRMTSRNPDSGGSLIHFLRKERARVAAMMMKDNDGSFDESFHGYMEALQSLSSLASETAVALSLLLSGVAIVFNGEEIDVVKLESHASRSRQALYLVKEAGGRDEELGSREIFFALMSGLSSGRPELTDNLCNVVEFALKSSVTLPESKMARHLLSVRRKMTSSYMFESSQSGPHAASDPFSGAIGGMCSSMAAFYERGNCNYILSANGIMGFSQTLKRTAEQSSPDRVGAFFKACSLTLSDFVRMLERTLPHRISDELRELASTADGRTQPGIACLSAEEIGTLIQEGALEHQNRVRARLTLQMIGDSRVRSLIETGERVSSQACPHLMVSGLHSTIAPLERQGVTGPCNSRLRVSTPFTSFTDKIEPIRYSLVNAPTGYRMW